MVQQIRMKDNVCMCVDKNKATTPSKKNQLKLPERSELWSSVDGTTNLNERQNFEAILLLNAT